MARSGSITAQIANFGKLIKDINVIDAAGRKAIENTVKDVKARAPGWIAQEVTKVYNIKKSEITPTGTGAKPKKMAGTIAVNYGKTVDSISIYYEGRLLTPVHFAMTPKSPPPGKSYTLKMQVIKGKKKVIGRYKNTRTPGGPFSERSHNILMGTGNLKAGGTNWIPFQRMSKRRKDLEKFSTISMPQMITSDLTRDAIQSRLNTEVGKRFEHHARRALGK